MYPDVIKRKKTWLSMCADSSAEHSNSDNGWKACPVLMMAKLPGTVELLLGRNIQPYGRQKPIGNDFGVNDLPFFFFFLL